MTHGNIPAEQIKKGDVLYFENKVSCSYDIVVGVKYKTISYIAIELDLRSDEINIYKDNTSFKKWNNKDTFYQHYEYCEDSRKTTAITDIFTKGLTFYEL